MLTPPGISYSRHEKKDKSHFSIHFSLFECVENVVKCYGIFHFLSFIRKSFEFFIQMQISERISFMIDIQIGTGMKVISFAFPID